MTRVETQPGVFAPASAEVEQAWEAYRLHCLTEPKDEAWEAKRRELHRLFMEAFER